MQWTIEDLHDELRRFEAELQAARLSPASIHTYVDRTERFLRWLVHSSHWDVTLDQPIVERTRPIPAYEAMTWLWMPGFAV